MHKTRSGFTIVELLIVIVVIGILAAITIVVYNGIQDRAELSKNINGLNAYVKAFSLYAADKGEYPSTAAYPCLGVYSDNNCGAVVANLPSCNLAGGTVGNAAFDALLQPYLGSKPAMSTQRATCGGEVFVGAYIYPTNTNTKNLYMQVHYKGNVNPCPSLSSIAVSSRIQNENVTRCVYDMPTLP